MNKCETFASVVAQLRDLGMFNYPMAVDDLVDAHERELKEARELLRAASQTIRPDEFPTVMRNIRAYLNREKGK
jgi:hypothetical protein